MDGAEGGSYGGNRGAGGTGCNVGDGSYVPVVALELSAEEVDTP